jgi:hypothetical protein
MWSHPVGTAPRFMGLLGPRRAATGAPRQLAAASALAQRRTIAPAASIEWMPDTLFPACQS